MDRMTNPVAESLAILKEAGFEHAESRLRESIRQELNIEHGQVDLMRTMEDVTFYLTGLLNGSKASATLSNCSRAQVLEASREMVQMAESSLPDPAFEIAPFTEAPFVEKGNIEANVPLMIERMNELHEHCKVSYPNLRLRRVTLYFMDLKDTYGNSNGSALSSRLGVYGLTVIIASTEGKARSSFYYYNIYLGNLDKPLHQQGDIERILQQSTEQLHPKKLPGSFTGDIIVLPKCLDYFLYLLTSELEDSKMIKGTSLYQNSLGKKAADEKLDLRVAPASDELPYSAFISQDGYPARNFALFEKGILKSHLLSLYGSNKTGLPRAGYQGDYYVIESGEEALSEMIASVDKGLLVTRFSGGMPGENGDFSGVAKNSYYIENGKIMYPVKEVMIKLNLRDMFCNIRQISKERINHGISLLPWIQFAEVPIQGKD